MQNLINWPELDYNPDSGYGYRSTGEGGLFAYAVWDLPNVDCIISTAPLIGVHDVLIGANGPLEHRFIAQSLRHTREMNRTPVEAFQTLELESQESFGTVLFLGSTGNSIFDETRGEYFSAAGYDLTDEGLMLIGSLNAIYGVDATLVTYLDT